METELKEAIENLLLQFMQNMHEWEVTCNDIEKQSELSFEEQFNKQKELVSKIFLTYCTPRERKYGKPNTISYGVKGSYEYDVDEEKITDIVDEGSVLFLTYKPLQPLHNGSEQHILGTLYDNRDSAAGLLLQVLGVAV